MAAPNILTATSVYGKTTGAALTLTQTTAVLACPANKALKVNSIIVSNVDGSTSVDVTVYFYDSSAVARRAIAYQVTVPAKSTLVVLSKDTPIYLEESDEIEAGASATSDAEIIVSYEEIDDA
jgi:hypothetical protein